MTMKMRLMGRNTHVNRLFDLLSCRISRIFADVVSIINRSKGAAVHESLGNRLFYFVATGPILFAS